jgi:hypothetical protein
MNTFHLILQRSMVCFFVLCFVLIVTYIPQDWNKVRLAEAGAVTGGAAQCGGSPCSNIWLQLQGNLSATASSISNGITSLATNGTFIKDTVLDGIGWMLAKQIISQMTASIVSWINSGFKGSPAFVQDLKGFLLSAADQALGQYLSELGGPLSFICSPFQLDIRIALATTYSRARDGQPTAPSCTLTGALANIENFMKGNFKDGGWDAWVQITSSPEIYTPYGSLLTAKTEGGIRIINAQGRETKLLDFGGGFLSSKICEAVSTNGVADQNCFISTPGKVIEQALTFQLSTGQRSLIAADEINEIISALMGQLSKQVITGAAGLLGLSKGTGYTTPGFNGGSYINQMSSSASTLTSNPAQLRNLIAVTRTTETAYQAAANKYLPLLNTYANNILNDGTRRAAARTAADAIPPLLISINDNLNALSTLLAQYDALPAVTAETSVSATERATIIQRYTSLQPSFHSDAQLNADKNRWDELLR